MKIILGDNQFFGVNHFDLKKGEQTKNKFDTIAKIEGFINKAFKTGLDGFMINSNDLGYKLISNVSFEKTKEVHYSIPYPHKYANMINETGMLSLGLHVIKKTSLIKNTLAGCKFLFTRNLKYIIPLILDIEIPKNLIKGSYVYLQNIVTDLLLGMGREDLIFEYIKSVVEKGYKPGIITLNPVILHGHLKNSDLLDLLGDLIVCFNINKEGFNVFPNKHSVEELIKSNNQYKLMGMSIFSSGAGNIPSSIDYIKTLPLDYVVFGTSKLSNVESNMRLFKNKTPKKTVS
ncbi:hypothetical protein N9R33_00275 [Schleiferiaceae bacterium]|nr:hypothetical protein [Schleiferiaceae bacterium]